jgi:Tol biopolymer transport system component
MPIASGARFGPYEIQTMLGAGGMGEVYRARDPRLRRDVALKVIAPHVANDPDRMRRFELEARASGALHHPNIVAVYDVGGDRAASFVVYELLDGESLRERLRHGRLPESETVRCAVQMARGLAAAHDKGIVHRDLKPGNVFLTTDGTVKLLDFGLAKLRDVAPLGSDEKSTALQTDAAVVLGTVGYMAPEQVRAQAVDHRADIFSFGVVLYEMLTGDRPFERVSAVETLSAILTDDPPPLIDRLPSVSPPLDRIIAHCLEKTPDARFQSARDLAFALEALSSSRAGGGTKVSHLIAANQSARPGRSRLAWIAVLVALLSFAAGGGIVWWLARPQPSGTTVLRRLTSDSGLTTDPAFSSDGKLLAYASDRGGGQNLDIWIQHMGGGEPVRLTESAADDHQPAFSPDGSKIVFRAERDGGGIYVIPFLGGDPRLIAEQGHWPRFSPDGTQIAYAGGASVWRSAFVVPASGGDPRAVSGITGVLRPVWSPDGKHLLVHGADLNGAIEDRTDWWVLPVGSNASNDAAVKTGALVALRSQLLSDPRPYDWVDDRIVFSASFGDSRNIWEVALAPRSFEIVGTPHRLTSGTELESQPVFGAGNHRLVFSTGASTVDLWSIPVEANHGKVPGSFQALTHDAAFDALPTLSADGRKLVFLSTRLGNEDVWVKDLESGKEAALTSTPGTERHPVVARDGTRAIYSITTDRKYAIRAISTAGGLPEPICDDCQRPTDWSRDGATILFQYRFNDPRSTLGVLDRASGAKAEILRHPSYNLYRGHFSPDERWVTFHADGPRGGTRVFIAPFRSAVEVPESEWIAVTDGRTFDDAPRWSPDGDLLYYFSDQDGSRCIWAQPLESATKKPVGPPVPVKHLHSRQHSVAGVDLIRLDLFVVRDKIVFTMGEMRGNIWMAEFRE